MIVSELKMMILSFVWVVIFNLFLIFTKTPLPYILLSGGGMLIILPLMVLYFTRRINNEEHGVYFSENDIVIISDDKYFAPWTEVQVKVRSNYFNLYQEVSLSCDGFKKDHVIPIFFATKGSFNSLVTKYAPAGHPLLHTLKNND